MHHLPPPFRVDAAIDPASLTYDRAQDRCVLRRAVTLPAITSDRTQRLAKASDPLAVPTSPSVRRLKRERSEVVRRPIRRMGCRHSNRLSSVAKHEHVHFVAEPALFLRHAVDK